MADSNLSGFRNQTPIRRVKSSTRTVAVWIDSPIVTEPVPPEYPTTLLVAGAGTVIVGLAVASVTGDPLGALAVAVAGTGVVVALSGVLGTYARLRRRS